MNFIFLPIRKKKDEKDAKKKPQSIWGIDPNYKRYEQNKTELDDKLPAWYLHIWKWR